jgi:hypothetical protein
MATKKVEKPTDKKYYLDLNNLRLVNTLPDGMRELSLSDMDELVNRHLSGMPTPPWVTFGETGTIVIREEVDEFGKKHITQDYIPPT